MDLAALITTYGPWVAIVVFGLGWAARNGWKFYTEQVFQAQQRREQEERAERKAERAELIDLVKRNIGVIVEVKEVVRHNTHVVSTLTHKVDHLYAHLSLPIPDVPETEDKQ